MLIELLNLQLDALNQQQRFNPFDRQANLLLPSAEIVDSESFWARIMRYFN